MSAVFHLNAQVIGECSDPNLEIKILRCTKTADKCIIDGVIQNTGHKDISWFVGGGISYNTALYDDMGNKNVVSKAWIGDMNYKAYEGMFPSQIPMKFRLEVEGVSEIATKFLRFDWTMSINNSNNNCKFKVSGIPIGAKQGSATTSANATSQEETSIGEDVGEIVNSVNEIVNLFKRKK